MRVLSTRAGRAGVLLVGEDRRLATLESLGLERYDQITDEHAAHIVDGCGVRRVAIRIPPPRSRSAVRRARPFASTAESAP